MSRGASTCGLPASSRGGGAAGAASTTGTSGRPAAAAATPTATTSPGDLGREARELAPVGHPLDGVIKLMARRATERASQGLVTSHAYPAVGRATTTKVKRTVTSDCGGDISRGAHTSRSSSRGCTCGTSSRRSENDDRRIAEAPGRRRAEPRYSADPRLAL